MRTTEWERQLTELREGKLRLEPPGESGLTIYASSSLFELRQYVAGLEHGYRNIFHELAVYRAKAGNRTLKELVDRQWSEGACLGYAVMGLRQAGFSPQDAICVLEAMEDAKQIYTLEQAAEAHQALLEDGGWGRGNRGSFDFAQDDGETADGKLPSLQFETGDADPSASLRKTKEPEWVGPSAELLRQDEEKDGGA